MEQVQDFINSIIDAKGYTTLDEETRGQLVADLTQRLMDQIDRAAIDALPEHKAGELVRRLDEEEMTEEKLQKFMQESGVDLSAVALETMLEFRALYLGEGKVEEVAESAGSDEAAGSEEAEGLINIEREGE